jgi:hypothetical protein
MFKEIVVEQIADFEEEVGVDPRSIEDFVDVLAREIKLFGKPGGCCGPGCGALF